MNLHHRAVTGVHVRKMFLFGLTSTTAKTTISSIVGSFAYRLLSLITIQMKIGTFKFLPLSNEVMPSVLLSRARLLHLLKKSTLEENIYIFNFTQKNKIQQTDLSKIADRHSESEFLSSHFGIQPGRVVLSTMFLSHASYILSLLTLAIGATILGLTTSLVIWTSQPTHPAVTTSNTTSSSFPENYRPLELILNLVTGAGGTVDGILLIICLFCIDFIYLGQRARFAKVSRADAQAGRAPKWLWGVTIFIVLFSIGRTTVGIIGSFVEYYTSPRINGRNVSERGFSFGGWMCQLKDIVEEAEIGKLCTREQAARWLTVPQLLVYLLLLGVLVIRLRTEKKRSLGSDSKVVEKS